MYAVETAARLSTEAQTTRDPTQRVRLLGRAVLMLAVFLDVYYKNKG